MSQTFADVVTRVHDRVPRGEVRGRFVGLEHLVPGQRRISGWSDGSARTGDGLAFQAGDVLFAALRPVARKLALAPWSGVASPEILVLRPRSPALTGAALAWLAHPDTVAAVSRRTQGTRMPRIRWTELAGLRWPTNALIDELQAFHVLFEPRLQVLHQREIALTRLLTAAWRPGPSSVRVGTVLRLRGPTQPVDRWPDSTEYLTVSDLESTTAAVQRWPTARPQSSQRPVHRGDLLLARIRPELRKVAVCPLAGACSPELLALAPLPGWRAVTLSFLLQPTTQRALIARATGTRMPRVPTAAFLDLPLPVSEASAQIFEQRFGPAIDALDHSPAHAHHLRRLRNAIDHRLLRGERAAGVSALAHTG